MTVGHWHGLVQSAGSRQHGLVQSVHIVAYVYT